MYLFYPQHNQSEKAKTNKRIFTLNYFSDLPNKSFSSNFMKKLKCTLSETVSYSVIASQSRKQKASIDSIAKKFRLTFEKAIKWWQPIFALKPKTLRHLAVYTLLNISNMNRSNMFSYCTRIDFSTENN